MSSSSTSNVVWSNKEKKDRISELPDAVIQHILSFLNAEDAVRSVLLSKRFSNLWANVSRLNFDGSKLKFISNALRLHKRSNLEQVSLFYCDYNYYGPDREIEYDRLIGFLSLSNVKDLTLSWHHSTGGCLLPQHLYSHSCLEKLTLEYCNIHPNGVISWKLLHSLSLSCVELTENTITNVLSGCPCLELLKFSECSGFHLVNLTNSYLRKLEMDRYEGRGAVEILAPHLQSLVLSREMFWSKCQVSKATSLTDCYLDFSNHWMDSDHPEDDAITMLTSLLEGLSHVEVVTLGDWVIKALSSIKFKGLPCPMSTSVKCLKLEIYLMDDDMAGIACLLRGLNCLEELFINKRKDGRGSRFQYFSIDYWTFGKKPEFHLKLKTINIFGFAVVCDLLDEQSEKLIPLFKFLMKTAKFLDNMTISAYGSKQELQKFTKKLLLLPRSSLHSTIRILEL